MSDSDPGWLLGSLIAQVPHTRSAVLLSVDGLVIAGHGLGRDDADLLAAQTAGLHSIAKSVARLSDGEELVRQVLIEMKSTLLSACMAGDNSILVVLADRSVNAGVLGYEIAQCVKSVQPFLASRPRTRGAVERLIAPAEPGRRTPPDSPRSS